MSRLIGIFDGTGAVHRPPYWRLWREAYAALTYHPPSPDCAGVPPGQGRVVLVIPAFLTTDVVTRQLRLFLQHCGYRSFGWGLGVNWGPTPRLQLKLRERLANLRDLAKDRVSLVGVSLGGLLARDLAYDHPTDVRQVITIASPINLPTASTIEPLIRLAACFYRPAIDVDRLTSPLPVSSASIFTRDDGLVAWESCTRAEESRANIEVRGPHLTLCRNPDVLRAVATKLASL